MHFVLHYVVNLAEVEYSSVRVDVVILYVIHFEFDSVLSKFIA